jgi:hypothetical protein
MSEKDDLDIEVESEESETTVVVTDSENYSETQKLKHIYELKKEVSRHISNRFELVKKYSEEFANPKYVYRERLSDKVALYVNEVIPLLESADSIDKSDYQLDRVNKDVNVLTFAETHGVSLNAGELEPHTKFVSKCVFHKTNELIREIGLGVDLEEETEPASI